MHLNWCVFVCLIKYQYLSLLQNYISHERLFLTFPWVIHRTAVMGFTHNQEPTEKIVLEGDRFPDIKLYQPFRVRPCLVCYVARLTTH